MPFWKGPRNVTMTRTQALKELDEFFKHGNWGETSTDCVLSRFPDFDNNLHIGFAKEDFRASFGSYIVVFHAYNEENVEYAKQELIRLRFTKRLEKLKPEKKLISPGVSIKEIDFSIRYNTKL